MIEDKNIMMKVLKLAMRGIGKVSPNPKVGCIIVKDGQIISEGWHKQYGDHHAEVNAISKVSDEMLEGSTLYVNLEPCSHHGKTPPCVDLIISKKIARVVVGMKDPNPLVAGKGIEKLTEAGIEVTVGILEHNCKWFNRTFIKYIQTGIPYITVKVAQSLDGCIAHFSGQSKWITSKASRKRGHALRAESDAIIVGKNTVIKDSPKLTVRLVQGENPLRVILDTNLSINLDNELYINNERHNIIVFCSEKASKTRKAKTLELGGLIIRAIGLAENGKISVPEVVKVLANEFNVASILVEGGTELYSSFAENDLIDEINLFLAPIIVGQGIKSFDMLKLNNLNEAKKFKQISAGVCGEDTHIIYVKNDFN